jgi:hypothetical protein
MKALLVVILAMIIGCTSVTEPQEKPLLSEVYVLPYNRHYDADAQFFPTNYIDTTGVLHEIKFYAYNFGDTVKYGADPTVYFNFFITIDYYDTLYFSPYLSTENDTEFTTTLNEEFNGKVNVSIYRYETFKPIDFRCEIKYSIK